MVIVQLVKVAHYLGEFCVLECSLNSEWPYDLHKHDGLGFDLCAICAKAVQAEDFGMLGDCINF